MNLSRIGSRWTIVASLAALQLTVFLPAAFGADDTRQDLSKTLAKHRRQAEHARQLVGWLSLSKQQAQRLLYLVEDAAELHIKAHQIEADLLPELVDIYTQFAHEDSLNQGFSPSVERKTAEMHREEKEAREDIAEQLVALEHEAASLLNETQRELAQGFHRQYWNGAAGRASSNPAATIVGRMGWKRWQDNRDKSALERTREELNDHNRKLHPRVGRLGKNLLHPAAAETICDIAGFRPSNKMRAAASINEYGTSEYSLQRRMEDRTELARLHCEINNWNLINGLNLDKKQINKIVKTYNNVRGGLEGTQGKANRASGRHSEILYQTELKVERILNTGQLQVLADYNPCLIPPKDLKNPVRAGQANNSSGLVNWLERARNAPPQKHASLVERLLEREQQHYGELSPAEWDDRADTLMDTIDKSTKMSEVDFQLYKEELASSIQPRDVKGELKSKIAKLSRQEGKPSAIAQHILKTPFIEQLQKRAKQLAGEKGTQKNNRRRASR